MSKIVGIDIGTYNIKAVVINKGFGGKSEIAGVVSAYNPTGQFVPSDEAAYQKLAQALKQMVSDHKLKGIPVHTGVPENLAYTSIVTMPNLSEAELASSIHWEAEQHIPVPMAEVNVEYEILYKPKKSEVGEKMKVLLVAARNDLVDRLVGLYHLAGLEVVNLETSMLAVYRVLKPKLDQQQSVLLCHMGATTTDLMVVNQGDLILTYTIQSGGLALTRAVEQGLGLPPSQAEEYKRAYGLDPQQLEGKVRNSMNGVLNILVAEIRKALQYYQTSHSLAPVRTMWLSGGAAYVPGLTTFLSETFSFEVDVVNPFADHTISGSLKQPTDASAYIAAFGYALNEA